MAAAAASSAKSRSSVVARSAVERALDVEARHGDRVVEQPPHLLPARALHDVRRILTRRQPDDAAARGGCWSNDSSERSMAFWPAASGSWQKITRGASWASTSTCSRVSAVPIEQTASGTPAWRSAIDVRVALDEHHAPGPRRRAAGEVGAVDDPALVEDRRPRSC